MKLRALLLIFFVSLLFLHSGAEAFRFSVGGFGGFNFPVAQEDAKSGSVIGVKARIPLMSFLAVEPNFTSLKNGDAEAAVGGDWDRTMTHEGGKFSSFGVDLALGSVMGYKGFNAYGIFGIASAKFEKKGIPDLTKGSYWFGAGFEYAFNDQISLDIRGKTLIFPYEDEVKAAGKGSRKNGVVTFGLNYYFGMTEE